MFDPYKSNTLYPEVIGAVIQQITQMACASIKDFGQIRVFDGRFMSNQRSNVSLGGKIRLWSDSADAQADLHIRCTQIPTCTVIDS